MVEVRSAPSSVVIGLIGGLVKDTSQDAATTTKVTTALSKRVSAFDTQVELGQAPELWAAATVATTRLAAWRVALNPSVTGERPCRSRMCRSDRRTRGSHEGGEQSEHFEGTAVGGAECSIRDRLRREERVCM
jgi:hypothetical protein